MPPLTRGRASLHTFRNRLHALQRSADLRKFALVLQRGSSESSKFALVLRRPAPFDDQLQALRPMAPEPPTPTRPLRPGTRRQHASAHHASPPAGATPVLRVLTSSTPHQCRSPPPVCLHMTAQRHALVFRRTRPTDVNLQEVSRFSHSEPPLYHAFSLAPIPTSLPAAHSQPSSSATAWQAQPQPIARSNASSSAPRPQPEP